MNKMKLVLILMIFTIILNGCMKKNELIITEHEENSELLTEKSETSELEKPLIHISSSDILKILVRQDGAPGMYLGEDNELHGFYVELERMVMDEMGQSYNLIPYSDIGSLLLKLKSGEVHSALAAPDLPDFRSFLNLSIPYEVLNFVTFIKSGDSRFNTDSTEEMIKSFSNRKIGVQTQGHIYQSLREYRDIELIDYPTTTLALEDLNKGLLDAVPDVERIGKYYSDLKGWNIEPIGKAIISQNITTAFSQSLDPSLLERYNRALESLIKQGKVKELYESYFGEMRPELIP